MGYYTRYQVSVVDGLEATFPDHEKNLGELTGYGPSMFEETIKWYSFEEDMRAYSKTYPQLVFRLSGRGEEDNDVWVKWFKDGEMQEWRLEYKEPTMPPEPWSTP
jgi:hypothetical protein